MNNIVILFAFINNKIIIHKKTIPLKHHTIKNTLLYDLKIKIMIIFSLIKYSDSAKFKKHSIEKGKK